MKVRVRSRPSRRGATTVEFAVVASAVVLLVVGLIVGGLGVFRYQEMAHLAREGSRYAATHGGDYLRDGRASQTGVPSVTSSKELEDYLRTKAVGLDPSQLKVEIKWSAPASVVPSNMPTYLDTNPNLIPPGQVTIRNYVTVTVSYVWQAEAFLMPPITLTSTSTMPMAY